MAGFPVRVVASVFGACLCALFAAPAAAGDHRFEAAFASAPAARELISSGLPWACGADICTASGPMSSPAPHICGRLAAKMGALVSFSVDGRALGGDDLARCNERAE